MKDIKKQKSSKYDTDKIPVIRTPQDANKHQKYIRNEERHNNHPEFKAHKPEQYAKAQSMPQHKKRSSGFSRIFISFLLIVSILSGTLLGYAYSLCAKTNYVRSSNPISLDITNIKNNVYNILLIGTDKEENGASRSDSMILVTINKNDKAIKLTSFMRDLWVSIPDHNSGRLNSAYSIGGADLLIETISENFNIKIDNYLLVNFNMFKELIDAIGGVTVDITEAEARFINRTTHATVESGTNTLNGDYALIYCRIRKLDSDFMRTQRQRKVISAIVNKIRTQNIISTISVTSDILPYITTDMSPIKMTAKLIGAVGYLEYTTEQLRIPIDGAYKNKTIDSQAVLAPDLDKNIEAIHSFIY